MTRTLGRSTRALASQRLVTLASMLALAACGDGTPVDATTNRKNLAGEETADVDTTEGQQVAAPEVASGDQGRGVGLSGAGPVNGTDAAPTDATAPESSTYTQYIAFGDSFTSGFGLSGAVGLSSKGNDCARDFDLAWPPLVNKALGIANPLIFAACSGATTRDITGGGPLIPKYQPRPQLEELPPPEQLDTALITVQIGGNDIKYDESFAKCVQAVEGMGMQNKPSSSFSSLSSPSSLSPECRDLDWLINNTTAVVNAGLAQNLNDAFVAIRNAAPNATIVAVGYPHLVDATPACDKTLIGYFFPADIRQRFNAVADAINAQIANAAANAGILALTTEVVDKFAGHEACSPDEWIGTLSIHPNAAGHQAYADVVANGVPAAPSTRTAVTDDSALPPTDSAPPEDALPGAGVDGQEGVGEAAQSEPGQAQAGQGEAGQEAAAPQAQPEEAPQGEPEEDAAPQAQPQGQAEADAPPPMPEGEQEQQNEGE